MVNVEGTSFTSGSSCFFLGGMTDNYYIKLKGKILCVKLWVWGPWCSEGVGPLSTFRRCRFAKAPSPRCPAAKSSRRPACHLSSLTGRALSRWPPTPLAWAPEGEGTVHLTWRHGQRERNQKWASHYLNTFSSPFSLRESDAESIHCSFYHLGLAYAEAYSRRAEQ